MQRTVNSMNTRSIQGTHNSYNPGRDSLEIRGGRIEKRTIFQKQSNLFVKVRVIPREIAHVSMAWIRVNKSDTAKTNARAQRWSVPSTSCFHIYTYTRKTITILAVSPHRYVLSIHHILSPVHSRIMRWPVMNQRRGISKSVSSISMRRNESGGKSKDEHELVPLCRRAFSS